MTDLRPFASGALAAAVFLVACAAAQPKATPRSAPAPAPSFGPAELDDLPRLDELAAQVESVAPLMREAARGSEVTAPGDVCYRAAAAARDPGKVWFEDATRTRRGEAAELVDRRAVVPPRGPVCVKKGETLRLVTEPAKPVRAVIWRSSTTGEQP